MISRTKFELENSKIEELFRAAGIEGITEISPLGAGEYNAVYAVSAGGKEYALKIAPRRDVPVLTYEKSMMETEVYWYRQLREHTDIRVPEIYYSNFEGKRIPADYFIMEKLPGRQLDQMDFTSEEKKESLVQMAQMVAKMHQVKNDAFGYIQNGLHKTWYEAIRSMTQALVADGERMGKQSPRGGRLLRAIDKHRGILEQVECTMVSSDLWAGNVICSREGGRVQYSLIDPERGYWGDRMADFLVLEAMAPLEKKTISLQAYNAVAEKPVTLTAEEHIRFAVVEGYLGLVMETEKYYRYTPRHFGWWRNVAASKQYFLRAFRVLER